MVVVNGSLQLRPETAVLDDDGRFLPRFRAGRGPIRGGLHERSACSNGLFKTNLVNIIRHSSQCRMCSSSASVSMLFRLVVTSTMRRSETCSASCICCLNGLLPTLRCELRCTHPCAPHPGSEAHTLRVLALDGGCDSSISRMVLTSTAMTWSSCMSCSN